jgi:2-dehydro-3-deoxyphosphogluconate aldolase/(4S)-4-hydroxy-2-oxoglutarate aldolase
MGSAFPHARFVPTGGTTEDDLAEWLAQPNVIAVGGSWLAPREEIARQEWEGISARAKAAVARHRAIRRKA